MRLIDTHAHPHMEGYKLEEKEFHKLAASAGVVKVLCVGTSVADSKKAIEFAGKSSSCHATAGLHPHDAKDFAAERTGLAGLAASGKVVAIGECGLDYYYGHSPATDQKQAFEFQLELAIGNDLPCIFHLRDGNKSDSKRSAYEDFFGIIDSFVSTGKVRGVVHSFTAGKEVLEQCLKRGLYIGLNGIMTFTKDDTQLEAAKSIPLERLVLETDSPFLTPYPYRGTVNHSGHVKKVAEFLSQLRHESLDMLAERTSNNAEELFGI